MAEHMWGPGFMLCTFPFKLTQESLEIKAILVKAFRNNYPMCVAQTEMLSKKVPQSQEKGIQIRATSVCDSGKVMYD